jgi:hypothetical protein
MPPWQTGPRRPCTGRESARADTPPWSASNSCLVRRTPAPSVHYTHSRVVLSTSPKPPRSPAPSGSPLAPLLLGARLDPAHPVAELHRAGGVGVVSKCWPSTGCATGRGRFWCKSCTRRGHRPRTARQHSNGKMLLAESTGGRSMTWWDGVRWAGSRCERRDVAVALIWVPAYSTA